MRAVLASVLLLGACGTATAPEKQARPAENVAAPVANAAEPVVNEAAPPSPEADPALADMSPSRRRAYDQGLRDCSEGRYNPDPYPEAYRIGCGAAQERKAAGR